MKYDNIIQQIEKSRLEINTKLNKEAILDTLKALYTLTFPKLFFFKHLEDDISLINFIYQTLKKNDSEELASKFVESIPDIIPLINTDVEAVFEGDPSIKSYEEVLISYPGIIATIAYRYAHQLYVLESYTIARIMSEYAHSKTGIDIHPGAKIGEYFCIDHGTGVVIGETAEVGHHVRLYQGVTLGTRSFKKDENGKLIRGYKRHPSVGNNVVIYANATILGGDTYIGDGCVIGSNTWIDKSILSNKKVKNLNDGI